MVSMNPFAIQQLQQAAGGQGVVEMSPWYPQQQAQPQPQQAPGGFPAPGTGNPAMDQFAQYAASREGFLNQARQQDLNSQWQRAVSSQDNFGSRYQRSRLVGQQLFNDVIAPMMAGPGAGGAQGAYEFIKDTNKRIDESMTNQTSERLKTAQTLNSLADIAGKADRAEWEKLGQTIKIHDAAARINNEQQELAYRQATTRSARAKAEVDEKTIGNKIDLAKAKTDAAQTEAKVKVEDLAKAKLQAQTEAQKLYGEYRKNYEAYTLAPTKEATARAKATKAAYDAKLAEYRGYTEQIKARTMNEGSASDLSESKTRQDLNQAKLGTEAERKKAWANKAAGVDPKAQSSVTSGVEMARKNGWTDAQILEHVRKSKKDARVVRAYEAYLTPDTRDDGDDDEPDDDEDD